MSTSLIQLVSEQTMPNVLPALALRPGEIVLVHTPQTRVQCEWIERALHLGGLRSPIILHALPDNPDHHATGNVISGLIMARRDKGIPPVVNITGGTKLMSIGGFAAANHHKVPNFYLDTQHRQIHAGTSIALPAPLDASPAAFRLMADALSVSVIASAHGISGFSPGRDPSGWLPAAHLLASQPELERRAHEFACDLLSEGHRRPADYRRLVWETPLDDLPDALIEPLALGGHIVMRDGRWWIAHHDPDLIARWAAGEPYDRITTYFATIAPIQQFISFLQGGWWELAVFEAARSSGRFRDLHWSAELTRPGGTTPIEEDILAVEDLNLAVISCKRGGDRSRLFRAIEELDAASRVLGGTHTRRYLAVASALPAPLVEELRARASRTRTTLIGPAGRLRPNPFL